LELHELEACVTAIGNQPPAEWLLIRDARSHLNKEEYRRAVIDAATAAELAMTALIDKFLEDANALEPLRKALARSSTNLGGKREVLNLLRPGLLHKRLQPDLIDKRNGASHRGEQYTREEATAALDIATAIVESAYPLASYLGGSPAPHSA
jgi:HEPN domain-containing protein